MEVSRPSPLDFRRRHGYKWDKQFCARRNASHKAEDIHILDDPDPNDPDSIGAQHADTATLIREFFNIRQSILDPPCLNFRSLKKFLAVANFADAMTPSRRTPVSPRKVALVDDRRDQTGGEELVRNWDSEAYSRRPPEGHNIFTRALNEKELYAHLSEKVGTRKSVGFRFLHN